MPRAIWKGAINFGLVHVPVALYPAAQDSGIDFDWLDRRSMDPVGYKRINKRTGKEVAAEDVVRGVKQDGDDYVVLSDDEIKAAYPKATQTIEIETFAEAREIPFYYLEKPYFLSPIGKGEKVYALLREAMLELGVIGIARVVMHSKERLAALVPNGPSLILNTIRWSTELRSSEGIKVPPAGKSAAGIKEAELKMARQLVSDMTRPWSPEDYVDQFTNAIHALAAKRVKAGQTAQVTSLEPDPPASSRGNVIDLTELLKRSLRGRQSASNGNSVRAAAAGTHRGRDKGAKRSTRGAGAKRGGLTKSRPRTARRAA
jgi:DNA end-binding protein Ku